MRKILKKLSLLLACTVAVSVIPASTVSAKATSHYSYVYDYWGDVQDCPNPYAIRKVLTYKDFGLKDNFKSPESIYMHGDELFICDTGNDRILEFKKDSEDNFKLVREITEVKGVTPSKLSAPADVEVSVDGNIFIADRGNARVIKVDPELNFLLQFDKPVDSTLDPELVFQPSRLVVDSAERVYCSAVGINKGLIKYEADTVFAGFIGATKVPYDFWDYLWKKFATKEQREQMLAFVPTEYANLYMDDKGFIYACSDKVLDEDLDSEKVDAVRKLNMLGSDILVRNGEWPVFGDLYWGNAAGISGASAFTDVTVFDNEVYVCLDKKRGRLFGYDNQGRMVFTFGGNGNMDGYFRQPVSIEHMDYDLLVLDGTDNAITWFTPTEYGNLIYRAMDEFDKGLYEESQASWEAVKNLDGSNTLAYIGIGRALMRQKQYKEAMEYFELKYDDENYSKAFQQYRKQWITKNIGWIIAVIVALFLVPFAIGKVKKIKWEIDTADIFKV